MHRTWTSGHYARIGNLLVIMGELLLIGLAIGDRQVRQLLGALPMPEPEEMVERADRATRAFLALFGTECPARQNPLVSHSKRTSQKAVSAKLAEKPFQEVG
jgi:hypothetical protein